MQTEKCAPTPARAHKPPTQRLLVHVSQMINFEKPAKVSRGENQDPQTRQAGVLLGSHLQLSMTVCSLGSHLLLVESEMLNVTSSSYSFNPAHSCSESSRECIEWTEVAVEPDLEDECDTSPRLAYFRSNAPATGEKYLQPNICLM